MSYCANELISNSDPTDHYAPQTHLQPSLGAGKIVIYDYLGLPVITCFLGLPVITCFLFLYRFLEDSVNKSMWKTLGMFVSLNLKSKTQFFFTLVNLLCVHCLILDIHVMLLTPVKTRYLLTSIM